MRSPKVPNHIQFPADTRYPSISLDEGLKASKLGTGRPLEKRTNGALGVLKLCLGHRPAAVPVTHSS